MLNIKSISLARVFSNHTAPPESIHIGDTVTILEGDHIGKRAIVLDFKANPFTDDGRLSAFVQGLDNWFLDYKFEGEIQFIGDES